MKKAGKVMSTSQKLDFIISKLEGHDQKFEGIDEQLEDIKLDIGVIYKGFENFVTKNEFSDFKDKVYNFQDWAVKTYSDNENERVITNHHIDRLERAVTGDPIAIGEIKVKLRIA